MPAAVVLHMDHVCSFHDYGASKFGGSPGCRSRTVRLRGPCCQAALGGSNCQSGNYRFGDMGAGRFCGSSDAWRAHGALVLLPLGSQEQPETVPAAMSLLGTVGRKAAPLPTVPSVPFSSSSFLSDCRTKGPAPDRASTFRVALRRVFGAGSSQIWLTTVRRRAVVASAFPFNYP